MEIWRQLIKRITKWNGTKRIQGTTQQEDENIFIKELNDEFTLIKRADVDRIILNPGAKPPEGIIL